MDILEYEMLGEYVALMESGKIPTIEFCERYDCQELQLFFYSVIVLENLRLNVQELYKYLFEERGARHAG